MAGKNMTRRRGDISRQSERGEASWTSESDQQINETPQQRLERIRRENTQFLVPAVRENQRANGTAGEQQQRIARERRRFLQEVGLYSPDTPEFQSFQSNFSREYMIREMSNRGMRDIKMENLNDAQRGEFAKIALEAETIIFGEASQIYDDMKRLVDEEATFRRTVTELEAPLPNRGSEEWQRFRVEIYDDMVGKYELNDASALMLIDIFQGERNNRSNLEQLNSQEYKTILRMTLGEWETWQAQQNI